MSATDRLRCDVPADWFADFSQCLFEWQGLEGGLLAVLAAGVSLYFLNRQIRQAQDHRNDEIDRRHIAAKLTMPLALSGASEVVQKLADEIASELESYEPEGFGKTLHAILDESGRRSRFQPVQLPSDMIGAFEKFVETLSQSSEIKHVSETVAHLQVLVSRFNSLDLEQAGIKSNLETLLLDAAISKFLIDRMFNYARNVDDEPFGIVGILPNDDAWDLIKGAAHGLVFGRETPDRFFPLINEMITGYKENKISPWLEKFLP